MGFRYESALSHNPLWKLSSSSVWWKDAVWGEVGRGGMLNTSKSIMGKWGRGQMSVQAGTTHTGGAVMQSFCVCAEAQASASHV